MRRNLVCGIGLSSFVVLAGLAVAFAAPAQTVRVAAPHRSANAQLVQALKSAHKLLAEADSDYEGHRAKAAQEVRKALTELVPHHRPKSPSGLPISAATAAQKKAAHAGQSGVHEAQATSDAQLRQAQQLLQGVLAHLNSRHPKAAANVNAAIAEINTALGIK